MKKRISVFRIVSVAVIALCMVCIPVFSDVFFLATPEQSPFTWNVEQQYCRLDTVENMVSGEIDGVELQTHLYLTYPSGKTVEGDCFYLDEAGAYTAKAMAEQDGLVYTEEKTFLVYTRMFEVEGGSAVYGKHPYTKITGEASDISNVSGLLVSIPEGSQLKITAPLDITGYDYSNPLLQFYVVSAEKGVMDFDFLRFTFTDLYDPDNYLTITCYNKSNGNNIRQNMNWWNAGATGQNLVGYQNDIGQDKVWVNSVWGSAGIGSFCMSPWSTDANLINDQFGIWMDSSLKVYAGRGQNYVCDLDDPKFHTNLWEGFSSNMVMLTIEADGYTGENPAQIFITHLLGGDLQTEQVFDTNAPEITLDCAPYSEDALPNACVGKPYPIPSGTARDPEMNPTNINIAVYGGMYSDTRYSVDAKTGTFTPDLPGTYTIVYTATDSWGNASEKYAYVYAQESSDPMSVELRDGSVSGKVGEKVTLAQPQVSGNFGTPNIEVKVTMDGQDIVTSGDSFVPYRDGIYRVSCTVTDYIGQMAENAYEIKVEKTDVAVFGALPTVARYMICGVDNYVPEAEAFDYVTADGASIETQTYIEDASGIHLVEGRRFTPSSGTTACTIWWEATLAGKTASSEKLTVPVIEAKTGEDYHLEKFFVCENVTAEATADCVTLYPETDGAAATWANPVLAEGFSLIFSAEKMENCTVILTDYEDPAQKLELVIQTSTGVAVINGNRTYSMQKTGQNFTLSFDPVTNKLSDGSTYVLPLDESGNTFGGFTSGKLYVDMIFTGVQSGASVRVSSINSQNLNDRTFDMLKPGVSVLGETGGFYVVGDQVTVFRGVTADVLSPFCTFYVNVLDPDGEFVTDVNGLKMEQIYPDKEYTITLTKIGAYVVQFYSEDVDGNKERNISYALNVLDVVSPILRAPSSAIPETAAIGEKFKIPTVTAYDAVDGDLDVYVYVQRPDLRVQTVTNGYVEFSQAGLYVIKYYAFDQSGNSAMLEYTVYVA